MNVRVITPRDSLATRRGEVVVCVPAEGRLEQFVESLTRVLDHTPDDVQVLIYGEFGAVGKSAVLGRMAAGRRDEDVQRLVYLEAPVVGGAGLDQAAAAAAPADVTTLGRGCLVADDWLARLRAAAAGDASIATVSAIGAHLLGAAGMLGNDPHLDEAAARVAAASLRLRPRLAAPGGPCVYIQRSAIELAGSPAAPDFAVRCLERGLGHLLADDVLVDVTAAAGDTGRDAGLPTPAARSVRVAQRALDGLRVVIDARVLGGPLDGTRVHVLELIAAVASTRAAAVTALVSPTLDSRTRALLDGMGGVRVTADGLDGRARQRADLVHRPYQVSAPADLSVLAGIADRLVVTQQDLISFHNPAYFPSVTGWEGYRQLTRWALACADRVVFLSEHVRADALAEELVEPQRASVVHVGVDHSAVAGEVEAIRPAGTGMVAPEEEVMLCLGTDFLHKNRLFALRVVAELQRRHGWRGRLVLAGPEMRLGSSRRAERAMLAADPVLDGAVAVLGQVSDAEKEWLLRRAGLVLYPTVHEGFGLLPFEAATRGVPCLWAVGTALGELLPAQAGGIVAWDPVATADRALALLREERARAANVQAVMTAAKRLRWSATGERLIELYRAVCDEPPAPAAALERGGGMMQTGLSEDAIRLVGPDGRLSQDLERPLLALLAHPRLAAPVMTAMKAGYRASQRRRRRRAG